MTRIDRRPRDIGGRAQTLLIAASVGLLALVLPASPAEAGCTVPPGYSLDQTNGYKVRLLTGLSGKAQYWPSSTRTPIVTGDVFDGVLSQTKISFRIHWQNGAVGIYDGDVTGGYVKGITRDQRTGASAGFVGGILTCASPPPPQPSGLQTPHPPIITRQPDVIRKPGGIVK